MEVKREGGGGPAPATRPSIKLELGIGYDEEKPNPNPESKPVMMKHHGIGKRLFTEAQLHELQTQAVIYKYIAAGLHVPHQLLVPIWRSVGSVLSHDGRIYKQFPKYDFEPSVVMDSEPGRCRRTDGKKWRCGMEAIPHQKYCERHVHRGTNRSRKLVEVSQLASPPGKTENSSKISSIKNSRPLKLQVEAPSAFKVAPTDNEANCCIVSLASQDNGVSRKRTNDDIYDAGRGISYVFGSGHSSILRGCGIEEDNEGEHEAGRCRRTDGKKWRCRRDVMPYQKYCNLHMHRGSKKRVPEVTIAIPTSAVDSMPPRTCMMMPTKVDEQGLDSALSMSIPISQDRSDDEKSDANSRSTDTTISDTLTSTLS